MPENLILDCIILASILKTSTVVRPEKKAFLNPSICLLEFKNHSINPNLVFSSWPIIEVLIVNEFLLVNSPRYLLIP